jgi:hypothetical protein
MKPDRITLLAEAGHFRDELETDPLQFEDERGPLRSVVQFFGGGVRGVHFSPRCFVAHHRPSPITVRQFCEPISVRVGQMVARILRLAGW